MQNFLDWLTHYSVALRVIIAFVYLVGAIGGGWFALYKYFDGRDRELRDSRFRYYQDFMREFPKGESLDRQISIVYQLRNFPEQYELSKEILSAWLKEDIAKNKRLVSMMQDTLKYIDNKLKK